MTMWFNSWSGKLAGSPATGASITTKGVYHEGSFISKFRLSIGRFDLPVETVNQQSGYNRYYDIAVSGGTHAINLELRWADANTDLDLYLLDSNNNVLAYSTDWNTSYEFISYAIQSGGRYRVRVHAYNGSGSHDYSLEGIAPLYNSNN